jgi:hypothetical protein
MRIDRELQLRILLYLRERYPLYAPTDELPGQDQEHFHGNLHYLIEKGFVEANVVQDYGLDMLVVNPRLTARGLDFLEGDGGPEAMFDTGVSEQGE